MRKFVLLTTLSILLFGVIGVETSYAQQSRKLSSTPKEFQVFFTRFRNAVANNDKKTVSSLTHFPFEYGWDAGDEGTYSKAEFLRKYSAIFSGTKKFFSAKNPTLYVENGKYDLTNNEDASHYVFEKKRGAFRFAAFIVEP